ncbi:putative uncharacterized protein DDB_G0282499 [Neltuma alba]|uniref:putative uncharacterized protein DDB_G0282499 n=1 Tax=Neltuma alba TaxID=207710 RepID=UPI0010A3E956|nr:putative uncharacterized protein DDB_G0282499 [Prosopis alba]
MVSLEAVHQSPPPLGSIDAPSSPRISFQADFLEARSIFRSITPESQEDDDEQDDPERQKAERSIYNAEFEFLSSNNLSLLNNNNNNNNTVLTADELFSEGKILPFWQMQQQSEKLKKISLRAKEETEEEENEDDGEKENDPVKEGEEEQGKKEEESKVNNWLVDEDPSPRPPNCTVLWKELLRLKKQRSSSSSSSSASVLSPSSSSSSSSSSSLSDTASKQEGIKEKKQVKKGMKTTKLERTRSSTTNIRIRPMINVPICTQVKSSSLPPLFSHKKRK